MQIIFATQNSNKVKEIQSQLDKEFQIQSLLDLNYTDELEETQETLDGNALQKARFVSEKFKCNCFADDTGLEIKSLNNEPGVYSARYAGEAKDFDANMNKVLEKLDGKKDRSARFRTVIALILNGKEYYFEGVCEGEITRTKVGDKGFGYDPIFKPKGYEKTFAEMTLEQKSQISHRGLAVNKLVDFLKNTNF